MTDVFLLIVEDRHSDTDVEPHRTEQGARAAMEKFLAGLPEYITSYRDEWETAINDGMRADGWIAYTRYSPEGDSVRIVKREMQTAPRKPRPIATIEFIKKLDELGVISNWERVRRVVLDAKAQHVVMLHVEYIGDERVLDVVEAMTELQVTDSQDGEPWTSTDPGQLRDREAADRWVP